MTDKNNLDKLFQKQLKNLEATPNKKVWNNIETKLKKKKARLFPFWWFSGAVAAFLILGLLLFPFSKEKNELRKINNTVITASPKDEMNLEKKTHKKIDTFILDKNNTQKILVADDDAKQNKQENSKSKKPFKNKIHLIMAKNIEYKNEEKLVSEKNAMKKIFLADNSDRKVIDVAKNTSILDTTRTVKKADIEKKTTLDKINNLAEKVIAIKVDLNEFVTKKDSSINKNIIHNKWAVAPVFGVLNSNSFTDSSPINTNLSNSTKGENTFSYGVQVAYKINNKWSIKSGVQLQEIKYTNSQVSVSSVISTNSTSVIFNNGNSFTFNANNMQSSDLSTNSFANSTIPNNNLTQNYGYIEIPVEVKYNLSNNRKLETELVAGFSSLFLNKNEILLTNTFSSQLGTAINLNDINFSGNLGVDFNYFIDKNWSLYVNPMFKVQLNTYNNNANDFLPLNFGVYSGIKYLF